MTEEKYETYKEILLENRKKILNKIEEIDRSWSKTLRESTGDISAYATHLADLGSESNEREKETRILDREIRHLKEIDKALKRIYKDKYGTCTFCGEKISPQRLRAIPETDYCITCKKNIEKNNSRNHRT
ncbi:MAG: TraR/DksA C4-type zinc finger protein [Candidatus Cloacimonetes bacterium]|nr:TraR/DksA C4-type zinc finger protein [Candidatus Cloacimonadota bacterium]MBS3767602.1 TraR/DksA C4-type zinc finger protein [Candidatus Cloacimonadota bacterium]